jgi:hypothetical protein
MSKKYEKLKRYLGLIVYIRSESLQRYEKDPNWAYRNAIITFTVMMILTLSGVALILFGSFGPLEIIGYIYDKIGLFTSETKLVQYIFAAFTMIPFYFVLIILFPKEYILNLNPNLKELEKADSMYDASRIFSIVLFVIGAIFYWNDISIF